MAGTRTQAQAVRPVGGHPGLYRVSAVAGVVVGTEDRAVVVERTHQPASCRHPWAVVLDQQRGGVAMTTSCPVCGEPVRPDSGEVTVVVRGYLTHAVGCADVFTRVDSAELGDHYSRSDAELDRRLASAQAELSDSIDARLDGDAGLAAIRGRGERHG